MSDLGNKEVFAKNLKYYMDRNGKDRNQICADLPQIAYTTLATWLQAKAYPRIDMIELLANYFGILKSDLVEDKMNLAKNIINVYSQVHAGILTEMIEDIVDTEEIDMNMLKGGKEFFGIKVKGDSMSPKYLEGDTIIVEKTSDCENGQDCVVAVNGNEAFLKRVFKSETGIMLQALNSNYEPQIYTNKEIAEIPITIIGVVRELRRKI